jgi:GalNAc-alpha-(1->4)-GalNAc-alpha-(1->3)-diNAcBac-PP-undecaprenol alpha-1,4-N-acetyl-D-galactosaminyltransferase
MSVLASAWAERGQAVSLVSLDEARTPAYELHRSVRVLGLGVQAVSTNFVQGLVRNLHRIRLLRKAIRESRPDIVISFMDTTNVLTILATARLGKPLIISERVDPALYAIGKPWSALRRSLYAFADVLVCPTRATVERFRAVSRVRGVAIANPIDVPARNAAAANAAAGSGRMLMAMGRLVAQKGFDLLLAAFSAIADRHPEWSLTIYGEGPLRDQLQRQAAALGIAKRVHLPGAVPDPFEKFAAADLFVFSSRFEGFGMALAEAMACGLPVISFNCPEGPGEIIRDGVDGILVPPQDINALAAALDKLMGDAQQRERLAARAPEVRVRFSLERALEAWQAVFDELAPGSSAPSLSANVSAK